MEIWGPIANVCVLSGCLKLTDEMDTEQDLSLRGAGVYVGHSSLKPHPWNIARFSFLLYLSHFVIIYGLGNTFYNPNH